MRDVTRNSTVRFGAALVTLVVAAAVAALACSQGAEGDRCNPDRASGESDCNGGLKCTQPALCPESYCCPATGSQPDSPYCRKGCNGGAASICNSGQDDAGACAFACESDRSDLVNASICSTLAHDAGAKD